jgi:hypothetical protein
MRLTRAPRWPLLIYLRPVQHGCLFPNPRAPYLPTTRRAPWRAISGPQICDGRCCTATRGVVNLRGMAVWVWGLTAWGDEVMQISLCAFFGLTSSTTATASQVDYLQVAARVLSDLKAGVQPRVGVNLRSSLFLKYSFFLLREQTEEANILPKYSQIHITEMTKPLLDKVNRNSKTPSDLAVPYLPSTIWLVPVRSPVIF